MRKWFRVRRLAQNLTRFSIVGVCIVFTPIESDRGNLKCHSLHQLLYSNGVVCTLHLCLENAAVE